MATETEDIKQKVYEARQKRENGDDQGSLKDLNTMLVRAHREKDHGLAASILGETLVNYQHRYEKGDSRYLEFLQAQALKGIDYCKRYEQARGELKTFHYRLGVAYFLDGKFTEAASEFETALGLIKDRDSEYPEFASYFAAAKVMSGGHPSAAEYAVRALRQLFNFQTTRSPRFESWHADIISCGIHMRLAMIAEYLGDHASALSASRKAKEIAVKLSDIGKGHRLVQYNQLAAKYGWSN